MLGLKLATDPAWVNIAEKSIEDILVDHAYCEQKAASNGISIIIKYPEKEKLVNEITAIVAEEWGHFRKVLKELEKRGYKFGHKRKDEYVNELLKWIRKSGNHQDQMIDRLMVCAMIEARSCERFRLLSLHIEDEDLKKFYHEFMVSEAGHYITFINLAKEYEKEEVVMKRWDDMLEYEAEIIYSLDQRGDRVH
ncbi:MAG: tRNA-(ms[2]io[6]A)-hydroxylase [Bacteroidetes bacterium]|jgi:tRNA-(ms[2]io[6]A)-hydroxylase|nr:tRNA-(ms[2]io[6]A)-hydroxylase [Bacteroidota bacterium]